MKPLLMTKKAIYNRHHYSLNKERTLTHTRQYKLDHKAEKEISDKLYRERHKDELAERGKEWRTSHKERTAELARNRYLKNKENILAQNKIYRESHKVEKAKSHKAREDKIRIAVLTHYGNGKLSCVTCGFNDIRALSLDHINGNGNSHRRNIHRAGIGVYFWLQQHNYPEGYQTLCMNCQFIKERGGKQQ